MTDIIRKQILIELINILENPRRRIQLNEIDIYDTPPPFSLEGSEEIGKKLGAAFSNTAEEFRYLFNTAYKKQTSVGRFQSKMEEVIPKMWEASFKMTWEDIKLLAEKDPAVLFALVFDTISLVEPTGVSDIISGSINLAYSVSHGDYILGPILSILQIGLGFLQAGLFIGTAGADTPLVSLIKLIVKGGWRLLSKPEVWIAIVKFLREIKDSIIEFFTKTKIGRRFPLNLGEIFENLFSLKPKNIPTSQPPKTIINDITKNQLEEFAKTFTKNQIIQPTKSSTILKDLLKNTAFSSLQLVGYQLGLGGSKLIAFQEKTKELQNKAEKYMRNVVCVEDEGFYKKCPYIKTIYPSLETKLIEKPENINISSAQGQTPDMTSDWLIFYDNKRKEIFLDLAKREPNYYALLLDMSGVPASQKISSL